MRVASQLGIALSAFVLTIIDAGTVMARPVYPTYWQKEYPESTSLAAWGALGCALCHRDNPGSAAWNKYGDEIQGAVGRTSNLVDENTLRTALRLVENNSSARGPGSGSYLDEINANTQPGWKSNNNVTYDRNGKPISSTAVPPPLGAPGARYDPIPKGITPPVDFDGDGRADIAVYRDGAWFIIRSSDGGVTSVGWGGLSQDLPVPGDYDGDHETDVAVYRDGAWFIIRSSDSAVMSVGWGGLPQDIPVPADYDGDGKTDVAVYRDGGWFVRRSSDGGVTSVGWGGLPKDIPVPADYDGDGKTDMAVYRDGGWFVRRSLDGGVTSVSWGGLQDDIPVPGDYDGDGKADIAIYRRGILPATQAFWFIIKSSDGGVAGIPWGELPQDIPVPGDYDGDGRTDVAVYEDGTWFVLRSSDGAQVATGWGGLPQDIPLNSQ